jgi:heme-degrading monooxygenase HmoA
MFARVTTYELTQGRASESIAVFEPAVGRVSELDGFVDGWFLVERDGLHAVTMTLWESLDAMERSRVTAAHARTEAARDVGAEVTSTYELEVGIHIGAASDRAAIIEETSST